MQTSWYQQPLSELESMIHASENVIDLELIKIDWFKLSKLERMNLIEVYKHIFECYQQQAFAYVFSGDYGNIIEARDTIIKIPNSHFIISARIFEGDRLKDLIGKRQNNTFKGSQKLNKMIHINFPNLQILNIHSMGSNTIEGFGFMNAPNLRCIEMYDNYTTSIKPLQKSNFKKLQVLSLYSNLVIEIGWLNRGQYLKLTGYELDKFIKDGRQERLDEKIRKNNIEDLSFLFKMENPILKKLHVSSSDRIQVQNISNKLKQINQNAKILFHQPRIIPRRRGDRF